MEEDVVKAIILKTPHKSYCFSQGICQVREGGNIADDSGSLEDAPGPPEEKGSLLVIGSCFARHPREIWVPELLFDQIKVEINVNGRIELVGKCRQDKRSTWP